METTITNGVKVSVETQFQSSNKKEGRLNYIFAYRVTIENQNDFTVQLMSRHWHILDSMGQPREVIGDGVIGQQPILEANQSHHYISGSAFKSEIGKMYGSYTMKKLVDDSEFTVEIPAFIMVPPYRLS